MTSRGRKINILILHARICRTRRSLRQLVNSESARAAAEDEGAFQLMEVRVRRLGRLLRELSHGLFLGTDLLGHERRRLA